MSIKEKLPMLNSKNRSVRYVGYAIYALVGLTVLGAIIGPEDNKDISKTTTDDTGHNTSTSQDPCLDDATLETAAETVLMQTGDFRTVDVYINEIDRAIQVEVEPSSIAYENPESFWSYIYYTVRSMRAESPCLDGKIGSVEVITKFPDYNVKTTYPYKAVLTKSEASKRTSTIVQR